MTAITSVPSSGIALDTSKAAKKPLTPEQREAKNRKLREKRAAALQAKAEALARGQTTSFQHVDEASTAKEVLAQDALPKALARKTTPPKRTGAEKLTDIGSRAARTGKKDKGGRRAIYGEPMHTVSFKCTKQQHATFLRAGGNVYLRARLDELTAYYAKGGK